MHILEERLIEKKKHLEELQRDIDATENELKQVKEREEEESRMNTPISLKDLRAFRDEFLGFSMYSQQGLNMTSYIPDVDVPRPGKITYKAVDTDGHSTLIDGVVTACSKSPPCNIAKLESIQSSPEFWEVAQCLKRTKDTPICLTKSEDISSKDSPFETAEDIRKKYRLKREQEVASKTLEQKTPSNLLAKCSSCLKDNPYSYAYDPSQKCIHCKKIFVPSPMQEPGWGTGPDGV